MKKTAILMLALALVLSLIGCAPSAPAEPAEATAAPAAEATAAPDAATEATPDYSGQKIVVQVWGGTYEETLRNYAIPMFEEQTGATVEVLTGAAPIAQLATEGANASVDVLHLDDAEIVTGEPMGIFETLDLTKIPNAADLYEQAFKYDTAVVTNWGTYGICYRTDLVKTAPKSWNDLWSEEYAGGKLGFYDYTMGGGFETLDMLSRIDGTTLDNTANWDNLFTKLDTLKPSIGLFFNSNEEAATQMTNGDLIATTWTNGQAIRLKNSGVPVAYAMPEEGVPAMTSFTGITSGSQNKELAYIFVNILLSPEVQQAYAENNFYAPSNSKTQISDELKAFMPYGADQVAKLIYLDTATLEPVKNDLIERWEQEFKN